MTAKLLIRSITMNTKTLRQKILDLAIHGKLVPQDPDDEPASELLKRIKAEKEEQIKEGKIKQSKKTKTTSDTPKSENPPFEIPSSWEWTTLGEIFKFCQGVQVDKGKQIYNHQQGYVRFLRIIDYTQNTEPPRYIIDPGQKYHIKSNDLVMIRYGSPGIPCRGYEGVIANNLFQIIPCYKPSIDLSFAFYFFSSVYYQSLCQSKGVALKAISFTTINKISFPLPPLAEQKRIVAEIERWFALIDQIEQSKAALQATIAQAKKKILDLAIHGKLVAQDPDDEPASELLKRINPQAEQMYEEELPKGWSGCNFEQMFNQISSKPYQILQSQIKPTGLYPVVSQSSNFIEGYSNETNVFKNDHSVVIFGDHTRNVKFIDFDFIVGADGVKILKPIFDPKYSYYFVLYASLHIQDKGYSRHFGQILKFHYLLPPLAEQKRIVKKIEELFGVLDTIQQALGE